MKYLYYLLFIVLISCGYSNDKLLIRNDTSKKINFSTLVKGKNNDFIDASMGGLIYAKDSTHPVIRTSILYALNKKSIDTTLYIVFYDSDKIEFVYKHLDSIVFMKSFITKRYTKAKLDSLKWVITYDGH